MYIKLQMVIYVTYQWNSQPLCNRVHNHRLHSLYRFHDCCIHQDRHLHHIVILHGQHMILQDQEVPYAYMLHMIEMLRLYPQNNCHTFSSFKRAGRLSISMCDMVVESSRPLESQSMVLRFYLITLATE